jgi:hypothetical protein
MGTLFQLFLLLSILRSDQSFLMSQLLAENQDLSSGIKYFDSRNTRESHRNRWTEDLLQTMLKNNCSCNKFDMPHEKDQDTSANVNQADTTSEVISFLLLSGGLTLLFKLAYSEYFAYINMSNEVKKECDEKSRISVSIGEYFQYRYELLLPFECS